MLKPCPDKPNCVCTLSTDPRHAIAPVAIEIGASEAIEKVKKILSGLSRVRVVESNETYLRAEFTSRVLRFVDDVEFFAQPKTLHFRSASRTGYSDLGVNRKRMEKFRSLWQAETDS